MNTHTKSGHNHLCMTCDYFTVNLQARSADLKSNAGECHRRPPVTTMKQVQQGIAVATSFPMVSDITWCGDHSELVKERSKDDVRDKMTVMEDMIPWLTDAIRRVMKNSAEGQSS